MPVNSLHPRYTRANNPLKFAQLQSRIDLYKYSFLPRTIIDWNNLKIVNIDTINLDTFKNIIDKLNHRRRKGGARGLKPPFGLLRGA